MELKDRLALVTGASGDLGAVIAGALAAAGAHVAVGYVGNVDGARRTAGAVEDRGRRTCTVKLDQADPASVEVAVEAAARELGGLDILVNNAAWNIGIPFPDLEALTPDVWDRLHATNVRGPYLLARAAARHMRPRGSGRIVNIASVAGLRATGSSIGYATSKAALIHLTRCLAVALAPEIAVNCVAPGLMEGTRMAQRLPPGVAESARRQAVLGRTTSQEDVAQQVVAFCRADSITGQTLVIDGGVQFH